MYTLGEWVFGAVHSVDLFYTGKTQSKLMVVGNDEGQLVPGRQGTICDNTAEKTVPSPARIHPTLPEQGKWGSPRDGSQGQPGSIQVTTQKFAVMGQIQGQAVKSML